MQIKLVIARHNENLSWIKNIDNSNFDYQIINKGDEILLDDIPKDKIIQEVNIGREAQSYLSYIVNNYDAIKRVYDSSNWHLFTQGNPFDHYDIVELLNDSSKIALLNNHENAKFVSLCHQELLCDKAGIPHHKNLNMESVWSKIFLSKIPSVFFFGAGAILLVRNDAITARPLSFWEKCLDATTEHDYSAHVFERIWANIFNSNVI